MSRKLFLGSLAVLSTILCILGASEDDRMKALSMQCREKNNLKKEEIESLKVMKYLETTDERIKCFLKCMLTGLNVMNEAGDFTVGGTEGILKNYKNRFSACKDVTGTDFCDKAVNFHNCIWKQTRLQDESE